MKETRDLWFSSYLLMNGVKLEKFSKDGGKLKFFFNLTDEEWSTWRLSFSNSPIAECKMQQEKLKDLLY